VEETATLAERLDDPRRFPGGRLFADNYADFRVMCDPLARYVSVNLPGLS